MLETGRLFFLQESNFNGRTGFESYGTKLMRRAIDDATRSLAFVFILSFPTQALFAEDNIMNRTGNAGIEATESRKAVTASPAESTATEMVANDNAGMANAITAIIAGKHHPYLLRSDFQYRAEDLEALYKLAGYKLLWLGNDRSEKNVAEALNLLENATDDGLQPTAYDTQILRQKQQSALKIAANNYKELALYDTAISLSMLRFLHDLHYGRVNPKDINFNLKPRERKLIDLPALINAGVAQGTIGQLPELVEPRLKQYKKLKQALETYRSLAKSSEPFILSVKKSVNPGSNLPQARELAELLIKLGDFPHLQEDAIAKISNHYTGQLVEAVKNFQLRHGMNADGVLGKDTVAAFNVPLSQRVSQIELAMERLRWLPEASAGSSIIVNIPAFQLWAFDDVDEFSADTPNMRVVVGKAMKNQTPVLMAEMSFIDFMPYWNVPYNIVKAEILPKLMQNPGYLASQNMELVTSFGNQARAVAFNGSSIAQLKQGTLKVRQRPGKKNALGKVKFIFPNKSDVYLHDTPSRSLFNKSRRDFSHGCVRVAKPEQLAEFALKNQWSKETIQQALHTPKTRRVILKESIPVTFFYATSFIDQYDDLAFYSDIYGYDAVLQDALNRSGDLSDDAIFVPVPESIPVEEPESIPAEPVEAEKQIEPKKPLAPLANYKTP